MTAEIIDMEDLKTRMHRVEADGSITNLATEEKEQAKIEENAKEEWHQFQRFFLGDMSEEDGIEYLANIAFVVIFGPEKEALGVIGQTDWGWFDTLNCAAHFPLPDRIQTLPIPELEEWGWDTEGMVESIAEYSITGCSSDGSVSNKPPLKKIVH